MGKKPGDTVALGDILGHPMEPHRRYARVVAIRKDDCRPIEQVIFRTFRSEDEKWPTGEFRSSVFICAWEA
jgi:hypothetical protein